MKYILVFIATLCLAGGAWAASAQAATCSVTFGSGGASYTHTVNVEVGRPARESQIGGPWYFIRRTEGPCSFLVFNDHGFGGRRVLYGTDIAERIRVGAEGAQDSGGWKARSMIVTATPGRCSVTLGDSGVSQTFFGPGSYTDISGWNFIRRLSGCELAVYNGQNFTGRQESYIADINSRIRVGWRIRSLVLQGR